MTGHSKPLRRLPAATLLERIPAGVAMSGPDGRIVYANPWLCSVLGLTAEELTGIDIAYFRTGPAARLRVEIRRMLQSGAPWHAEIALQTRAPEARPVHEWCYPLHDAAGRMSHVVHFFHDLAAGSAHPG